MRRTSKSAVGALPRVNPRSRSTGMTAGIRRGPLMLVVLSSYATRCRAFVPFVPLTSNLIPPGGAFLGGQRLNLGCYNRRWTSTDTASQSHSTGGHRRLGPYFVHMSTNLGPGKGTQVVLLRHGMSTFNKQNIFTSRHMVKSKHDIQAKDWVLYTDAMNGRVAYFPTKKLPMGWCDVPLAEEGKAEAYEAGKLLATAGYRFDVAYASVLKRACTSLHRLLEGCNQPYVPVKTHWRLNERHYGALQGRNKASLEEVMGPIVVEWRRGYSTPPPPMTDSHPHWPLITFDSRYRGVTIPETESLADTAVRVMEYWESEIVPEIRAGKRVVIVSHANTIRALVKRLDDVDDGAIRHIKIPTGEPFVYEFDSTMTPVGEPNEHGFRGKFIGDMISERNAAVEEYKRREEACMSKWESNPELVPEECICAEDIDWDKVELTADADSSTLGDAQASLGLDRYSVGFDLPLPTYVGANDESGAQAMEQELGGPVIDEAMAGLTESAGVNEYPLKSDAGAEEGRSGRNESVPDPVP